MIASVTLRSEFETLRSQGLRVRCGAVRLSYAPSIRAALPSPTYQLAFAINRKFGSAVERNRARRRLRAGFHGLAKGQSSSTVTPGMYLIVPNRRVLVMPFDELLGDLQGCLERLSSDN